MTLQPFRINGICLVRDEVDIIEQTLTAASEWCDRIYVYDNGSTDGTWEKVNALVAGNTKVKAFKQDAKPFVNGLRSEVFNHYRSEVNENDWWCILDADEIYIDNPRLFLSKILPPYDRIWSSSFQYYFTDKDLEVFNSDPLMYADDVPVEKKLRYYRNNWSELRFFRHKNNITWDMNSGSPMGLGAVYPTRIWLKHFQYRSPEQIQKRLDIRSTIRRPFVHEIQKNWNESILNTANVGHASVMDEAELPGWRDRVVSASQLDFDSLNGSLVSREEHLPELPLPLIYMLREVLRQFVKRVIIRIRKSVTEAK